MMSLVENWQSLCTMTNNGNIMQPNNDDILKDIHRNKLPEDQNPNIDDRAMMKTTTMIIITVTLVPYSNLHFFFLLPFVIQLSNKFNGFFYLQRCSNSFGNM